VQEKATPGTIPREGQTEGDCHRAICGSGGELLSRDDPADTPADDGNPCTREVCVDGQPGHPFLRGGKACGQGGVCDESGHCLGLVEIRAGRYHSCIRLADASVKCWGQNDRGQLGDSSESIMEAAPVQVAGLTRVAQLALGGSHSCALLTGGQVTCWGANEHGQLGDGTTVSHTSPVPVSGLPAATAVAAGHDFTCALTAEGQVLCWGNNGSGQLARGRAPDSSLPTEARGLRGATQISLGGVHGCALFADRSTRCWGNNIHGQLGDGTRKEARGPVVVQGLAAAVELAAGRNHTCARLGDGGVRCWGWNNDRQLGSSSAADEQPTPVAVDGVSGAASIAAGNSHSCALLAGGQVNCWGWNSDQQLGSGDPGAAPRLLTDLAPAAQLALGSRHSCARLAAGGFLCWGNSGHGQLGAGAP
jgi:alpha-tubulin suppressor-like RCC1 family protein